MKMSYDRLKYYIVILGVAVALSTVALGTLASAQALTTNCVTSYNPYIGLTGVLKGKGAESCSTSGTLSVLLLGTKGTSTTVLTLGSGATTKQTLTISGSCPSAGTWHIYTYTTWTYGTKIRSDSSSTVTLACG